MNNVPFSLVGHYFWRNEKKEEKILLRRRFEPRYLGNFKFSLRAKRFITVLSLSLVNFNGDSVNEDEEDEGDEDGENGDDWEALRSDLREKVMDNRQGRPTGSSLRPALGLQTPNWRNYPSSMASQPRIPISDFR